MFLRIFLLSCFVFYAFGHYYSYSDDYGGRGRPPPARPPPRPPRPAPPANRPKCGQGWYTSYRPQGIWCLRVGIGKMNYNGAIAQCATYGGILSGLQNAWEVNLIQREAIRQTLAYNIHIAGVWLGAQRTAANTFRWTDGVTTGTAAMKFGPGQPDNSNAYGRGPQNCLQLIAMSPDFHRLHLSSGYFNRKAFQTGQLDDTWCANNFDPPTRMYACGKAGPPG